MDLLTRPWRHYVDFAGRSRRLEYLLFWVTFYGALAILGTVVTFLSSILSFEARNVAAGAAVMLLIAPVGLFIIAAIVPGLALSVRRLHDIGISGWWMLIWLVPVIGQIFGWLLSLVIFFVPGPRGANRYGLDPHDPANDPPEVEQVFR